MDSVGHVAVPLKVGGKKMRKKRELDALVSHSLAKRNGHCGKRNTAGNGVASHDQLLSQSTDENEEYSWPKIRTKSRCRSKRFSCFRTCGPLLLVSSIFLSLAFVYWLYFDIREQISEYRIRIEQVTATSQNVPEALQKWHETSKNLEQNQTILYGKITEIQLVLKNFSLELKHLKEIVDKKNENSQENQLTNLRTSVATLGSKIEDSIVRVSKLEENYLTIQTDQKDSAKLLTDLQAKLSNVSVMGSGGLSSDTANNSNTTLQLLETVRKSLSDQLGNLALNVSAETSALKQQTEWLQKDVNEQKKNLDTLSETSMNISTHVTSIEKIWTDLKDNISKYEKDSTQFQIDIQNLKNTSNLMSNAINNLQTQVLVNKANNDKKEQEEEKSSLNKNLSTNIPDIVNRPPDTLSTLAVQKLDATTQKPSETDSVVVPSAVNKISQPDNSQAPNEKSTSNLSKYPFDNVM